MAGRVVVGIDRTDASSRALEWAASRAAHRGESLALVHVVDETLEATGDAQLLLSVQQAAEEMLQKSAQRAAALAPAITVTTSVEQGSSIPEVFERLSREAELIVVGSDWRGGDRSSRKGTHSLRIAAASKAPVAVIPDVDVSDRRGVVVGADGSDVSKHAIAFAAAEADRLGEPLIAVYAWSNPIAYGYEFTVTPEYLDVMEQAGEENLAMAIAGLAEEYPDLEIQRVVVERDPAGALLDAAAKAQLLVVGSHGRGAFARLLLGSVSHGVLANLIAPTVIAR